MEFKNWTIGNANNHANKVVIQLINSGIDP
jgi:hypothetical protein